MVFEFFQYAQEIDFSFVKMFLKLFDLRSLSATESLR